ncbi:MAG: HAD-IB family phosphatase, partial [Candidatus Aenigmarchaeota archaeon]|nr:HAD-IB family phosphatase [Candidatus Aenigmarchaeota archaeon]MDI6722633.1 HAD-IB family phosphatase [Candidatus Aenigmarchaeota archaeon]
MSRFKVVCFDFDNVIIDDSVSRLLGLVGSRIQRLKLEIDFLQDNMEPKKFFKFAKKFAKMGKGMNYEMLSDMMMRKTRLTKGACRALKRLKKDGHKIVIVSTNDELFIRRILERERILRYIDHIYASRLVVKNGLLTGEIKGDVVRTEKKGAVKKIKSLLRV